MPLLLRALWTISLSLAAIAAIEGGSVIAGNRSIDYLINPYNADVVDSWLFDINQQGRATGYIVVHHPGNPFIRAAVTYQAGVSQIVALGSGSSLSLTGLAINGVGDAVGNVDDLPVFISAGGTSTAIEIPDYYTSLFVAGLLPGGVNDAGQVLISAFPNDPAAVPSGAFSGLAIWRMGVAQPLTGLDPLYPYTNPPDPNDFNSGPSSSVGTTSVTHLNNAGQFAASVHEYPFDPMDADNPDDDIFGDNYTGAYIYDGLGGYSLLESAAPGEEIRPIDIDEAGTVFGWTGNHLALWGADGALQLVLPDPSTALDDYGYNGFPTVQRNSLGQVVGVTVDGGVLLYDPDSAVWTDITATINGLGTGMFSTIQGYNDAGQFVGLARPPQGGGVFGYVVSSAAQVPEPTSLAVGGVCLLVLSGMRSTRAQSR